MVDETPVTETTETEIVIEKRPLWQRILKWVAVGLLSIVVLVGLLLAALNTSPGRRFLADEIGNYTMASGLNIQVGRIEGSVYGAMVLKDVRVRDTKGVFLTSPEIDVDWRPFRYLHNHIDIRSATSHLITLHRSPALKATPSQPNQPLLPNINIDVNRLKVDRLVLAAPVTGTRRILSIAGQAHIADRRAQIVANAAALNGPGVIGGDRLSVKLDAVPDANRLDIDAHLFSPAKGVVAGMTGVTKPMRVAITGDGDWKAWNGRAKGTLGGQSLVDLALTARNGTFSVRGNAHPGLYMSGPVARLTAPQLDIALDTTLDQRRAQTKLALRSSALAMDAQGLVDLANSRFGNFQVDARLLTPGAVAPKLAARNAAAHLTLNGAFATPTVDYVLRADAISFGNTGVQGLYAAGDATVNAHHILVPVHARAARITGVNAAGGLLDHVTLNGDIAIDGSKILSTNLKVRSDRIDATAIIAADMATGKYTGGLKGRVNNYRIESIGIIDLQTNADLATAADGAWAIHGHIAARTQQIFNSGVRSFLGGNAVVSTDFGYDTNGVISFANLHLSAPQFRVTSGSGRYDPSGALLVNASAYSTTYGPLTARVTGNAASPVVLLRAPRPGLGVGLANLEAHARGRGGAYAVTATGNTNYGPFNANVLVRPSGRLRVDVNKLLFAGVDFHGAIAATPAGPFAGTLQFAGSGLNGTVRLADQGGVQRADINGGASNAKIPGPVTFTIGRAIINASVVMYPKAPSITGDVQLAALHYGPTVVSKARAHIDYRGGNGTAQLVASGSSNVPFELAANAKLSPDQYLVALKGTASGVSFHTANPARITHGAGGYELQPTRIDFDKGSLRLAGRYGNGMAVQARLDRLDLTIANAFVPGLDIGGNATGSLAFEQAAGGGAPQGQALINIANFTRSGVATVSEPVDIVLRGTLQPNGADARALVKRGDTTVGRLVATLQPLGAGGSWSTRLAHAALNGGIRYNGPSAVLFSLAGVANQQLTGPIAVAADFSGRLSAPQLRGMVRADNLTYDNNSFGTHLTNVAIAGTFDNDRFALQNLSAKAGE
ncbi:MAG: translocation/assembly module TamB domain-containing protein, partial [Sphingomonas sp.]